MAKHSRFVRTQVHPSKLLVRKGMVQPVQQATSRNMLIRAIEADAFSAAADHLRRVQPAEGSLLAAADRPIARVYFPETVVASTISTLSDGSRVDVGLSGYEAMIGWPLILGDAVAPHDVIVHAGGSALCIDREPLLRLCAAHPCAAATFMRYVAAFVVQIGATAASNLRDSVERRLSRWLLMFHDRLEGDRIELTHKTIAAMLGIRRASVTDGIHLLEGRNLIRNRRGQIVIRDREQLRCLAGEGYGHAEAHYSKSIAPFGK